MKEVTEALKLQDPDYFDFQFWKLVENMTHEQAYEHLEERYHQVFKRRRYANFESFRVARIRRSKSKAKP